MKIPRRNSMVIEVADSLRNAIRDREFLNQLPSVRKLSRDLHVSIPTILGAMRVLESEGLVQSQPGKRTLILPGTTPRHTRGMGKASQVAIISFGSNWIAGSDYYQSVLHELRELGIRTVFFECTYTTRALIQKEVEELTSLESPDCWVLLGPPPEVQSLFAKRQIPCLIDGVTIPGLPLPDFEVDYCALYRHAINHLQRNGHCRICLLTTEHSAKINPESIAVFKDHVQRIKSPEKHWEPIRTYNGTTDNFTHLLRSLFLRRSLAPTALVIAMVKRVAGTMTWLMKQNLRIPEDVSIISRDYDNVLECLYPFPAHYRQPPSAAKRFVRAILAIIDKKHTRSHHRIMTEFIEGTTVASQGKAQSSLS